MDVYFYSNGFQYPFQNGEGLCQPDHRFDPKFMNSWRFETESALRHEYGKQYPNLDHYAMPVFQTLHSMNLPNLIVHVRLFLCAGNDSAKAEDSDSFILLFSSRPREKDAKWASFIREDERYIQVDHVCSCVIFLKDLLSEVQGNWAEFFLKKFADAKQAKQMKVEIAKKQLVNTTNEYKAYLDLFSTIAK